jgi:hypothetical protein
LWGTFIKLGKNENIIVTCPICNIKKTVDIPKSLIQGASHLTAVLIPKNAICVHTFHAFVDKNLIVRGYQKTDFELPITHEETKLEENILLESELNDFEAIKWNISPNNLENLIKCIIFNKNVVFVIPDSKYDLKQIIQRTFKFIFRDTFKHELTIIRKSDYKKMKNDFKNDVVIGWNDILRDKEKFLERENREIEEKIVRNFYRNASKHDAIINFEYEIRQIFKLSKKIIQIIEKEGERTQLDVLTLKEQIKNQYTLDLDIQYLRYILKVVRYYFKVYVPIDDVDKVQSFLDLF